VINVLFSIQSILNEGILQIISGGIQSLSFEKNNVKKILLECQDYKIYLKNFSQNIRNLSTSA